MMIWQDRNMSECFKSVLCEIVCAFFGWDIEVILRKMHGATIRFICYSVCKPIFPYTSSNIGEFTFLIMNVHFKNLILYVFHAIVLHTQVYSKLMAQLVFNSPTFFSLHQGAIICIDNLYSMLHTSSMFVAPWRWLQFSVKICRYLCVTKFVCVAFLFIMGTVPNMHVIKLYASWQHMHPIVTRIFHDPNKPGDLYKSHSS